MKQASYWQKKDPVSISDGDETNLIQFRLGQGLAHSHLSGYKAKI